MFDPSDDTSQDLVHLSVLAAAVLMLLAVALFGMSL